MSSTAIQVDRALSALPPLKLYIGGRWTESDSQKQIDVVSPATGKLLAKIPHASAADVNRAVESARKAWEGWHLTPPFVRAAACHRIADRILARKEEIATILSAEQGKPYLSEALPEVEETAENFRIAAEDVKRLESPIIPARDPNKRFFTFKVAIGTWAIITPWNFPTVIPSEYFGPGIAAGNTIVFKPASLTPLATFLLTQCSAEAELPPGVFNLVSGSGSSTGNALITHPGIDGIGLTGETSTGDMIQRRAGVKKLLMELGGNGPQIVLEDADLVRAAKAAAFGAYFNAGQVCCATERVLVDRRIHKDFLDLVIEEAKRVRVGDPFMPEVKMGPMNNAPSVEKTEQHLANALQKGARVVFGGKRVAGQPTNLFFEPTVVDNVSPNTLLNQEETFGPVVPLIAFEKYEQVIELANGTGYGLQMAIFTRDIDKAFHFADRLRSGNVVINDTTDYWEAHEPFGGGGGTRSGYGRLGGRFTFDDMTHLKTVALHINDLQ